MNNLYTETQLDLIRKAAPEMYEALKAITDCYFLGVPAEKFIMKTEHLMFKGRAAVLKAEGK